jgi:glutathione S-transferase
MSSSNLILHHYPISPYSQKIRVMLGYTNLEWQSVITAAAPPRPQLFPLTGGYRKIPVGQIGADIFCDSRLIAREIAAISNRPELLAENLSEEARTLMTRAENELFFACGLSSTGLKMIWKTLKEFSLSGYIHFMKDRIAMGKDSSIPFAGLKESREMVMRHLHIIEQQLKDDFLFGALPNLADFSVYHGIWMLHKLGEKHFMRQFPKTVAWVERIGRFGTGKPSPLDANSALAIARTNEPRTIDSQYQTDIAVGKNAVIAPTDYAKDATQGILVGSTPHSWILARENELTGIVHVHFPKNGYALT